VLVGAAAAAAALSVIAVVATRMAVTAARECAVLAGDALGILPHRPPSLLAGGIHHAWANCKH